MVGVDNDIKDYKFVKKIKTTLMQEYSSVKFNTKELNHIRNNYKKYIEGNR